MNQTRTSQHIVIFGGTSGIGLEAARALKGGGCVTVTGRDEGKLGAARLEGLSAVRVDALSPADVAQFFVDTGPFDHLVITVSGAKGAGDFATLDLEILRQGFDGKFWAQVLVAQAALRTLRPDGSITFITAASARASLPRTSGLAAINGAIEAMIKPLARELAPRRINAISPGVVETAWWDRLPVDVRRQVLTDASKKSLVGRNGNTQELGQAVAFIVNSGFITGTILEIDGGVRLT